MVRRDVRAWDAKYKGAQLCPAHPLPCARADRPALGTHHHYEVNAVVADFLDRRPAMITLFICMQSEIGIEDLFSSRRTA